MAVGSFVDTRLATMQLPDEHLPVCQTGDGVDAEQVVLPSLDLHRP